MPPQVKPSTCESCSLFQGGLGYVPSEGDADVLLMGEAAGFVEAQRGAPFQGPAGMQLNRILSLVIGSQRARFMIDNVCRCKPPGNELKGAPYEEAAIAHCAPLRQPSIDRAKVIVALGAIPARVLTGVPLPISEARGYVFEGPLGKPVVPTFHPAFLMRGMQSLCGVVGADIGKAIRIGREGYRPDPEHFNTFPTVADFRAFHDECRADPEAFISVDIETPESGKLADEDLEEDPSYTILCCSFAVRKHHGLTVKWVEPFISIAREILALPNPKVMINGRRFDMPRLAAAGCPAAGWLFDPAEGWKRLQAGLPAIVKPNSLGFMAPFYVQTAPWKHLSHSQPEYYSVKDAVVALTIALGVEADLKAKGMWESFRQDSITLVPLLERMGAGGVRIDTAAQEALKVDLDARIASAAARLQQLVPDELKNVSPKRGYLRTPMETVPCPQASMLPPEEKHPRKCVCKGKGTVRVPATEGLVERAFTLKDVALGALVAHEDFEMRWCRIEPFLPNSPDQIKRYMKAKGHAVPSNKANGSATTEADSLRKMAKRYKDPVYELICAYRQANKVASTYIYKLGADGRVRTHFKFASTGRLRSYGVNLQNIPKRGEELGDPSDG